MLLSGTILRHGRLRHSGRDFNLERNACLQRYQEFLPGKKTVVVPGRLAKTKLWLGKNQITRALLAMASQIKIAHQKSGGHLRNTALHLSYVRIPKSASTSISFALLRSVHPALEVRKPSATDINFLADAYMRRGISNDDLADIFFTVVRNPYARIVSVYRDFFERGTHKFIYQDYIFGIFSRDLSFREFVKRLENIPDQLKDLHLKPQFLFIQYYRRRTRNVVVLRLEKPDEIHSFLALYGLDLPVLNSSPEDYDYRSYYDRETLEIVSRIYRKDLRILGYESEYNSLLEFIVSEKTVEKQGM